MIGGESNLIWPVNTELPVLDPSDNITNSSGVNWLLNDRSLV